MGEEDYIPQESWANGVLLLGKGLREDRQRIQEQLDRNPTGEDKESWNYEAIKLSMILKKEDLERDSQ